MLKSKKILPVLAVVICLLAASLSPGFYSQAAKKKMQVKLQKEYTSVTFTLEYSKAGSYTSTVTSPSGAKYDVSRVSDTVGTCIVESPESGTWTITIQNNDMDEIPEVKVSASATKSKETDVVKDIQIGKDIAGLTIYFKNDNVCVEWGDDTCGDVSVEVVDMDSQETLGADTVGDKQFTCAIPTRAKNIAVTVVPSSSSNISGAAQTFNFKVSHELDAEVIYPEMTYVNSETVPVEVHLGRDYGIQVENNGEVVLRQENVKAGDYTFDIPLPEEGENNIQFFMVDQNGNMRSVDASYIKDVTPPTLEFDKDYNDTVHTSTVTINGSVSNYQSLTLNGNDVSVATDGKFSYECTLHEGENELVVCATDDAGNEIAETIVVYYTQSSGGKKKVFLLLLLGLAAFFFFKKSSKKGRRESVEETELEENEESEDEEL